MQNNNNKSPQGHYSLSSSSGYEERNIKGSNSNTLNSNSNNTNNTNDKPQSSVSIPMSNAQDLQKMLSQPTPKSALKKENMVEYDVFLKKSVEKHERNIAQNFGLVKAEEVTRLFNTLGIPLHEQAIIHKNLADHGIHVGGVLTPSAAVCAWAMHLGIQINRDMVEFLRDYQDVIDITRRALEKDAKEVAQEGAQSYLKTIKESKVVEDIKNHLLSITTQIKEEKNISKDVVADMLKIRELFANDVNQLKDFKDDISKFGESVDVVASIIKNFKTVYDHTNEIIMKTQEDFSKQIESSAVAGAYVLSDKLFELIVPRIEKAFDDEEYTKNLVNKVAVNLSESVNEIVASELKKVFGGLKIAFITLFLMTLGNLGMVFYIMNHLSK